MVWSHFSYFGRVPLVVMNENQNSKKYTKLLEDSLLDWADVTHGELWVFQQDICPIHVSEHSKNWFASKNISL